MKFPRNAKIFRGHLDVAPFAGVFFCLAIFLMLLSLVYTPGVAIQLPVSHTELPGVAALDPVTVGLDPNGRYYFEDQTISESNLQARLKQMVKESAQPLTLIVYGDKKSTLEQGVHLMGVAADAGIAKAVLEVSPPFDAPAAARNPRK